jgi:ABC-type taurine transport system ATPase subunit
VLLALGERLPCLVGLLQLRDVHVELAHERVEARARHAVLLRAVVILLPWTAAADGLAYGTRLSPEGSESVKERLDIVWGNVGCSARLEPGDIISPPRG